ncbi:GTP cyclohydrolase II [Candidatus Micrarchaeota archaeon]|nr:GTP cyclohydrolase II [Candidatus Micrarchaeota archaeon]MBI5176804.1 GTP cyclohydrolase II [Candidatus Micrarchaeota archaeon]
MKSGLEMEKAEARLPTRFGEFNIVVFQGADACKDSVALVKGEVSGKGGVLCRVHSQCLTGDAFCSLRCDCREQLEKSMELIGREGTGIIIYLMQEGRGIGLFNKVRAYALQEKGLDTVEANLKLGLPIDSRDYRPAAIILAELGVKGIRLLTNNPKKESGMKANGVKVESRVPIPIAPSANNAEYLRTKREKLGHLI